MSAHSYPEPDVGDAASFTADPLAQICGKVAGAFRRKWGRGPAKTTAHWAGPNILVVLLHNGHTEQEKAIRAAGHVQQLLDGRQVLQQILEDELKAIVANATAREVLTMLSATRLDPDLSAEIFLLGQARTSEHPRMVQRVDQAKAFAGASRSDARAVRAEAQQARVKREELHK